MEGFERLEWDLICNLLANFKYLFLFPENFFLHLMLLENKNRSPVLVYPTVLEPYFLIDIFEMWYIWANSRENRFGKKFETNNPNVLSKKMLRNVEKQALWLGNLCKNWNKQDENSKTNTLHYLLVYWYHLFISYTLLIYLQ